MSNVKPGDLAEVIKTMPCNGGKRCVILEYGGVVHGHLYWIVQMLEPARAGFDLFFITIESNCQAGERVYAQDRILRRVDDLPPDEDVTIEHEIKDTV